MKNFNNKIIAVTGAGSGIGRALVIGLRAAGAKVAASDIVEANLQPLREYGGEAELLLSPLDVSDGAAMTAWAASVKSHFGAVDGIINNAGVALSCHAASQPRQQMEWLFGVNYWGVINGVEAFLPELLARPEACIVNISSLFGIVSVPSQSSYNAAKFAVRGYSESLRQDLRGTSVKVVTVHPGGIKTNIAKNGRHLNSITGNDADIAKTADLFSRIASTSPEKAASVIMHGMRKSKPRVLIGGDAKLIDIVQRLFPSSYDRLLVPIMNMGAKMVMKRI
ncbi:Putative oxidoreductase SadH [Zhongshania aliphaticivorans]|uniref:Oxidoreductase SadH n=2 Tax=Zhongshania aliphaticivorans TaxID=1470434 RepID=A0A5S9NAX2_9GAMM|nr:Putative oxidoreductase SadH [Zhongshania aliphaticivorans]CAA0114516.1 Putative oxidoreductase SadH [Zhongshania aliphaticivorans]